MTLQTFSDTPNTFTFNYTFKDFETAQVAGHALIGYMTGTFYQPVIEVSYHNDGNGGHVNQLAVEYVADAELVEVFKRICDSFKDYYNIILDEDLSDEDIDDIVMGTSKNTSRASRASNLSLIYSLFLVNFCL